MRTFLAVFFLGFFLLCFASVGLAAQEPTPNLTDNNHGIQADPWAIVSNPGVSEGLGFYELESTMTPLRAFYRVPTTTDPAVITAIAADVEMLRTSGSLPHAFLMILADILRLIITCLLNIP